MSLSERLDEMRSIVLTLDRIETTGRDGSVALTAALDELIDLAGLATGLPRPFGRADHPLVSHRR
jgi:hypothetical protein